MRKTQIAITTAIALLLPGTLWAIGVKKVGDGDRSSIDGVCGAVEINEIITSESLNSPNWNGLTTVLVSSEAGGSLPLGCDFVCGPSATEAGQCCASAGECTGDGCDEVNYWADEERPLRTVSAAFEMWERNTCGVNLLYDELDDWYNLAIGDNASAFLSEGGFDTTVAADARLDCSDGTDNLRVGLHFGPYRPSNGRIYFNFAWQTANVYSDIVVTGTEAGEATTTIAGQAGLTTNQFATGEATMIDDADAACGIAEGETQTVSANDATTLTVGAFSSETGGCVFIIEDPANTGTDGLGTLGSLPLPDVIFTADNTSTTTALENSELTLTSSELVGGRVLVTAVNGSCAQSLGGARDISANDTDTVTVDAFTGDTTGCTYTIVADSASGNSVSREHFQIFGRSATEGGMAVFENINIHNSYEVSTLSQSEKPGVGVTLKNFKIHSELENGSIGPLIHNNADATHYYLNFGISGLTNSIGVNSSGSGLCVGCKLKSKDTNDVDVLFKNSARATAFINSELICAEPTVGTDSRSALQANCDSDNAADCDIRLIHTVASNCFSTAGAEGAVMSDTRSGLATSFSLRLVFTSITNSVTSMRILADAAPGYQKKFFGRASIFDDYTTAIMSFGSGDADNADFDFQDSVFDDSLSNHWVFENNSSTVAAARTDLDNSTGATCGGVATTDASNPCDTSFFPGSDVDINGDSARGTPGDSVRLGHCHEDLPECYQATTYQYREVLPARLALPAFVLESGERCRIYEGEPGTHDRGA